MRNNVERLKWLDLVRSIAIACVVLCHVVESGIYIMSVEYMQSVGNLSKLFAFVMFTFGRMGVPFFLLITGWLLLDREYTDDACFKFWKSKIGGLLFALEVWIVVYNIFFCFFYDAEWSIKSIVKEMLLLKNSSMNHMWYMPMILGMYITIPFVSNALRTLEEKTILIPYMAVLICFFGIPTANVFVKIAGFVVGETIISTGFSGGCYGLYIVTGYLLKKGTLKRFKSSTLFVCYITSLVITVLMQVCSFEYGITYNLWYNNLFLFVSCVILFELLERTKSIACEKVSILIARYSFAIYLIHNPINIILKKYSLFVSIRPLRVILVWITTIFFSFGISIIIEKIPKVGKKILYMR